MTITRGVSSDLEAANFYPTVRSLPVDGSTVCILTHGELKWRFTGVKIQGLPGPRMSPLYEIIGLYKKGSKSSPGITPADP